MHRRHRRPHPEHRSRRPGVVPVFAVALALLSAVACGRSGGSDAAGRTTSQPARTAARPSQTIDIAMVDHAFAPAEITVPRGETITLRFTNKGSVAHEAFMGDADAQADHEAVMSEGTPHHSHDHAAMPGEQAPSTPTGPAPLRLGPGMSGTITHAFDHNAQVEIACHEAGHYAAGMKLTVNVA